MVRSTVCNAINIAMSRKLVRNTLAMNVCYKQADRIRKRIDGDVFWFKLSYRSIYIQLRIE